MTLPIEELTGIEDQTPTKRIKTISKMAKYINDFYNDKLFDFDKTRKLFFEIVDKELKFIDKLFDDKSELYSEQIRST